MPYNTNIFCHYAGCGKYSAPTVFARTFTEFDWLRANIGIVTTFAWKYNIWVV